MQVKRRMIRNNCETKISQNKLSTIRNREYSKQGRERNKSNLKYQISVTDSKRDYSRAQRSGELEFKGREAQVRKMYGRAVK